MAKTILLTGATDGIGLEAAKLLATKGHRLLLHGRSDDKLADAVNEVRNVNGDALIETYRADLSKPIEVEALATSITNKHKTLGILINNAGVFKTPTPRTENGYDIRFIVNSVAPYVLAKRLLPLMPSDGRIINLSSAAQSSVDLKALLNGSPLRDSDAYAQSKLAITMWSFHLADVLGRTGPSVIAVNPASFLGSKMVKDAYGMAGKDLSIGASIIARAALNDDFADATGRYFDNDLGQFAQPHSDALDKSKNKQLVAAIEAVIARTTY